MRIFFVTAALCGLGACSDATENQSAVNLGGESSVAADAADTKPVAKADEAECDRAKKAAVKSRQKYDRDYESRNPGAESKKQSEDELNSCKLSAKGAFLGKWGGQRWRFVPKSGSKYVEDPKKVWVGENEGLDDLSWFSEWRSDGASVEKNEELNRDIKAARNIYG